MAIDLTFLGRKVASYREQQLATVEDVSAATGIDRERLQSIEQGAIEPSGDEILILADHFKCDFRFFISNERVAPFEQTRELYRSNGDAFTKEDRLAVQEFLYLSETEAFLQAEMGTTYTAFSPELVGSNLKAHGPPASIKARQALGIADSVVPEVYSAMRQLGIHVFRRKLGNSSISGVFIQHPIAGKCALINFSEDVYRQRFSAAHEMAHAIFDADQPPSVSFSRVATGDYREYRANSFASCFLMLPQALRGLPSPQQWSDEDARRYANRFKVSCHALGIALKEAGVADEQTGERIRKLRVPAEAKIDPELPSSLSDSQKVRKQHLLERGLSDYYVCLCFEALHREVITIGRLSEALLCSTSELGELAAIFGRALHGH
jgi:Zn-dependent peptidase ImmA (M78 family)/transcriptional regulator with XRE-family HTH domain